MAMITVILGDETLGNHTISRCPFSVGRDEACDIPIDNIGVSRHQCRFVWTGERYRVEDTGSSNGTFVNGEKVEGADLKDGDEVRAGKFRLIFHQAEGEPPPATGEEADGPSAAAAVEEQKPAPAQISDHMKTFQIDSKELQARLGAVQDGGRRASDLAADMAPRAPRSVSKKTVYIVIGAGAALMLALLVVVLVLALNG